jgi:hypothetical protein
MPGVRGLRIPRVTHPLARGIKVFRWTPGAAILGIRNPKQNRVYLNAAALAVLGIALDFRG